ncbi:ATP-binding protein [Vibrio maerlii]|uniref:ATP-binding protein n=1 Tax=Vibrio maerlii TaxID=2231648 RepID=UPI000E3E00F4|nr:ATP-binding protein [Vibrio maerlii]
MGKLILIRGLPGSGKSTLAQKFVKNDGFTHLEADMYFVNKNGEYCFDPQLLSAAHDWCQKQTVRALRNKQDVVVSNTFVQRWEIKPYAKLAKQFKVTLEVMECQGAYGSIHDVPEETIAKMKRRWQIWE